MEQESPRCVDAANGFVVMVTGCAGFIGHNLCEKLLSQNRVNQIVGLDECNDFYGPEIKFRRVNDLKKVHSHRFRFFQSLDEINNRDEIDTVFHLAGQANVRYCQMNPKEAFRCNQEFTRDLLKWVPATVHFVFVSSSSVYGSAPIPWNDKTAPAPQGHYGMSKLECEALVQKRGAPATIVRPFSIVGAGSRPDLATTIFFDSMVHRDTIEVFGDGSASRDFTHVDDLNDALVEAMKRRRWSKAIEVYPIGSGRPRSVREVLSIIQSASNRRARLCQVRAHEYEVYATCAESSKAKQDLLFSPRKGLDDAVADMICDRKQELHVVVVVATRHRQELLRNRALPSVQNQTFQPHRVCVVIDEEPNESSKTDIQALQSDFPGYQFIHNTHTRGACGAWNCGVMAVSDLPEVQKYCYLAILDDDDSWEPNHLELCLSKAKNGLTDWVISGITRHEDERTFKQRIPEKVRQADFLIGNPHVQGSNLFLSLRLFYRAGMFDEYLPSCTDRDLCVRIFDVAKQDLNIETTAVHTVHHFAESQRVRLSSPHSKSKELGIRRFAEKHLRRMTHEQREEYWRRASRLFGVERTAHQHKEDEELMISNQHLERGETLGRRHKHQSLLWNTEVVSLLFGVISSSPQVVAGLMEDISRIPNSRLLLLANGVPPSDFEDLMERKKVAGGVIESPLEGRLPIAEARTILQLHCGKIWEKLISLDAVVIMDDDKRLPKTWFANLEKLLNQDVLPTGGFIGPDLGAPPLPPSFSARTSMLDWFYSMFHAVEGPSPTSMVAEDSFYDLSEKSTYHLEFPVPTSSLPEEPLKTVLKGIPISRKATVSTEAVDSSERGGCCVVLDKDLLVSLPNPRIELNGIVCRRSDMLWVKVSGRQFIKHPALAVHHDRTHDQVPGVAQFFVTAKQDLLGAALCRPRNGRVSFLRQRLKRLNANILRIQGLLEAVNVAVQPYFSYNRWVQEVIIPVHDCLDELSDIDENQMITLGRQFVESLGQHVSQENVGSFVEHFRTRTAKQILLEAFPGIRHDVRVVACGSEGVVFNYLQKKYKILDCYRPRDSTFKGDIRGITRQHNSCILVSPFIQGETYSGGNGPYIVNLLRQLKVEQHVCFRNWSPSNLVVNEDGVFFVDFGRDVVAYSDDEFLKMARRAYLCWRFANHGAMLKQWCRASLAQNIPPLDGVEHLLDAINDVKPDRDLYNRVHSTLKSIQSCSNRTLREMRILDFGCGKAKFQKHTGVITTNYDPEIEMDGVHNDINDVSGVFDVVLCLRVLCVLPPDVLSQVLAQIRERVCERTGRVIFSYCDPRAVQCDCPEECFSFDKTVSTGRTRPEWYRPIRVIQRELCRAGFEIIEEFVFYRVDQHRFEKHPNQWCCVAKPSQPPRHSVMIKTCFMEHATIAQRVQHLVETLPCGVETILVLDGKQQDFVRKYDDADETSFRRAVCRLEAEGWIDRLLEPPNQDQVALLHSEWFGFEPDFEKGDWTHDKEGVQYASTFHGFDACQSDLVLQVDSDLMVCSGKLPSVPPPPYWLFEDPLALTWSLPIASRTSKDYTTGHRFEVRGCVVSVPRLKKVFRSTPPHILSNQIGRSHWYRVVDDIIGNFKSYRGSNNLTPFFVHPQNDLKGDERQYLLALDAVQSGRLSEEQYDNVDFVGCPWKGSRTEPFVIVVCGRNVAPGRMLRCIASIKRNMDHCANDSIGLIVIDDASDSRQSVRFLEQSLPVTNTTFISRRKRVGGQVNLALACRDLISSPRTVVCTVDLDDALLGNPIPDIQKLYQSDPMLEAAFGGCVNVRKPVRYIIDETRPVEPRNARGQPFWTHLRTFRKLLFDRIRLSDLGLEKRAGASFQYVVTPDSVAHDWSYCVPIWEQAKKVVSLPGQTYLYEPDGARDMAAREAEITTIMALPPYTRRVDIVAVVGDAGKYHKEAFDVGFELAKAGFPVMTGGLGGVMEDACAGARKARGSTVGVLPGADPTAANPFVQIAIPTGLGHLRNGIVANASALIVVGGGSGTHAEVALGWSSRRLIVAMKDVPGFSQEWADRKLDDRVRYKNIPDDRIYGAKNAKEAVSIVEQMLPHYTKFSSRL